MNFPGIRIEGGLFSSDILNRIREEDNMRGQRSRDFYGDSNRSVKDEIARAWADAQDYWRIFQRKCDGLREKDAGTSETRQLWIIPFLGLLGYDLQFRAKAEEINGKLYPLSHRAVNRADMPVHIIGIQDKAGLDRRAESAGRRMSAHAMVQEFLNLRDELYGMVTNGHFLRLLRDSSRLVKLTYLEFDLDRIFTDSLFADFALLYRLLHVSRMPASNDTAAESLIEQYHQDSLESGERIRDGLSKAIEKCIHAFANGLLDPGRNKTLCDLVKRGDLKEADFFQELLRLIYRLLFLMVIEERDLVFPPNSDPGQRRIYEDYYSIQRLRRLSEKRYLVDKNKEDLWLALFATFRLYEAGGPGKQIGIAPLAGDLFSPLALRHIALCQLGNDVLLDCIRNLNLYTNPITNERIRVNYGALNVEEFGSVYEGLLEFKPVFHGLSDSGDAPLSFTLAAGDDRAATGAHYTPDDLVQPLIRHSLDHLIERKLEEAETEIGASLPARQKIDPHRLAQAQEKALLSLRVADIACGSGHILLAAARRIATTLARIRTGEDQPSPENFRRAVRDVIRNCIYGVDINPLAVELCKVALWLEAHIPGQPLNFLDHHIKCGNAIVGYVRQEDLEKGIPDEAFSTLPGDDKSIAADLRKRNKEERNSGGIQGLLEFSPRVEKQIDAVRQCHLRVHDLPENTPDDIEKKKHFYNQCSQSKETQFLNRVAALPIAQFYIPRTRENSGKWITQQSFKDYYSGHRLTLGEAPAEAWAMAHEKRFFHWFIEFPEIIQEGGFDCILGNPPYLGGQKLSGTYGHSFCNYVKWEYEPAGLSELVVYFLRRIIRLLKPEGFTAIITTNSIKDGDIRKDGLDQVLKEGATINMAARAIKWPGQAKLIVSLLSLHNGSWTGIKVLDGRQVSVITSFFEEFSDLGEPNALWQNKNRMYQGYIILGDGFKVCPEEEEALLKADSHNAKVLYKTINGSELNNKPDQEASQTVISFGNMEEEEAASYKEPFQRIRELVMPERQVQKLEVLRKYWWKYGANRPGLSAKMEQLTRCFVAARTTKFLNFSKCPTDLIFTDAVYVFTTDRWELYSIVQSTIHEMWARKYSGALKQDLRYSPSKCFDTYAFPEGLLTGMGTKAEGDALSGNDGKVQRRAADFIPHPSVAPMCEELARVGEEYHEFRRQLMLRLWLGLTDIYNLFHDPEVGKGWHYEAGRWVKEAAAPDEGESTKKVISKYLQKLETHLPKERPDCSVDEAVAGILELRRLHVVLDEAVLKAYGWSGADSSCSDPIDLHHDFYEVDYLPENDRVRYTISPAARRELLTRLLALNHARAAEKGAGS